MLVFQHPQLEERKVSTRLGAFTNHTTRARRQASKRGARNSAPSGPSLNAARTEKVKGLLPRLNFPESLQATFKFPGPYKYQGRQVRDHHQPTNLATHSAATVPASLSPPSKKTKISKPKHLWEQPLASCPALCNQPVLTTTGGGDRTGLALWSTRSCPGVAAGRQTVAQESPTENP